MAAARRACSSRATHDDLLGGLVAPGLDKYHQEAAEGLSGRLQHIPGLTLGGTDLAFVWGDETVQRDLRRAQLIALPILLVLLLVFFRGVVAGLLPLALGGLSILLTELALRVASGVTSISVFTLSLVCALGSVSRSTTAC